jgi:hypothetical protein
MTNPELTALTESPDYQLLADRGTMRMILTGALSDANLWGRAVGATQEIKNTWARRSTAIRALLAKMPAPENPRDPYEDLPGEPTQAEADEVWRARAVAEDTRDAARKAAMLSKPTPPATRMPLIDQTDLLAL